MIETLKPRAGLKVRKPDGSHLSADGEPVELNTYWRRRITAGDVETIKPMPAKKAATKNTEGGE